MYKVTMSPFSIRLLSFAGGPQVMASSIRPFLPTGIVFALAASPLCIAAAAWAPRRWERLHGLAPRRWKVLAGLAVTLAVYGGVCHAYVQRTWTDPNRWERRIAQSPHGVLLFSCVEELLKDRVFTYAYSFEEIDDREFREAVAPKNEGVIDASHLAGPRPKNVILIVMESTGVEYFGLNGSKYDTTPQLAELAARNGVVFENVYTQAASSCKSLVALSASTLPRPDWLLIVRDFPQFNVPTAAEVLKERGYRTCYAHAGYWSWQGRDKFLAARGVDAIIGADGREEHAINSWGIDDDTMFQEVLDWIDAGQKDGKDEPFFAFAYTIETHHPYVAPPERHDFGIEDDEEFDRYLNAVRGADAKIARLMQELERRGLAESTVVAVTSDHGESFGQHGQRVHSFGIYEPTVHVPLVLLHPSLKDMPRRSQRVGRHVDIAPTLLGLLGVPAPAAWQGRNLLVENEGEANRAYFLCVGNEVVLGLREGDLKYHYYVDTAREELFDLAKDPAEEHSLARKQPERCREFRARLGGMVTYQREFLAKHGVE
jgi:arylsulfatase A-like enzyme